MHVKTRAVRTHLT